MRFSEFRPVKKKQYPEEPCGRGGQVTNSASVSTDKEKVTAKRTLIPQKKG